MRREYHSWHSPHLGRPMELLAFGHAGARAIAFPARDGRFFEWENWRLVRSLSESINGGHIQLFCVDSIDRESLYCDWCRPQDRMTRHLQYEAYILHEVLPWTATVNKNPFVISVGCSFGAYHAVNIAFRHPHLFGKVVGLSGRYDLTISVGDFRDLFDGYYDQNIYYNLPSHYVPRLEDPAILAALRRLEITLAIGEHDPFVENNRQFSAALCEKEIPHALHFWHGEAHKPRDWRRMLPLYL